MRLLLLGQVARLLLIVARLLDWRLVTELLSYLSGLVIGEELRAQDLSALGEVIVIGSEALTTRYARALNQAGAQVRCVGAEATWRGLWAVSQALARPDTQAGAH